MSDITTKLKAVLRMRSQLEGEVHKLDGRISECERRTVRLRRERDAAAARFGDIDEALRPLAELAEGVVAKSQTPPVIEGGRRKIDLILEAVRKRGVDEWSPAVIATDCGLPVSSVSPYIATLLSAKQISRTARGRYCKARVATVPRVLVTGGHEAVAYDDIDTRP